MTAPKKTLKALALDFINKNPNGVTCKTIHELAAPKSRIESLYSALWVMKKDGLVRHDIATSLYYPPEETQEAQVESEPEMTGTGVVGMDWEAAYEVLGDEYLDMQREIEEARIVINWLETKVETLIRAQVI